MKCWVGFVGLIVLVLAFGLAGCNRAPARTDAQVAAEVQSKLRSDGRISTQGFEVKADHGVVTLSGDVASDDERASAAGDAATVEGVRTVVNDLVVQQADAVPQPGPSVAAAPANKSASDSRKELRKNDKLPQAPPFASPALAEANAPSAGLPKASAEAAVAQAPAPQPPPKKISIPAGTQLTIRLNDTLDTERNQVGDTFHGTLGAPIVIDSETAIPSGADVVGRVVDVKSAGRLAGNSALKLELSSLSVNGKTYNIQTNQWLREGKGEGKNTAVKAGGGAAIGAIIGGLAGGGKGAAIGAGAGAGAGTGVAATKKGEQIKLPAESTLSFLLIDPVTGNSSITRADDVL
jgi:hypothetical protein